MKKLSILLLTSVLALGFAGVVQAATITWGSAQNITSYTDANTEGKWIAALSLNHPTVNGVEFTTYSSNITHTFGPGDPNGYLGNTGDTSYNNLIKGGWFSWSGDTRDFSHLLFTISATVAQETACPSGR